MSFVRWRQAVITRMFPHKSNKRFLITGGIRGKNPTPSREPWQYHFRTPGIPDVAYFSTTVEIDFNVPGEIDFIVAAEKQASVPEDAGILLWNGTASLINESGGLTAFINGVFMVLRPFQPLPAKTFHTLSYKWDRFNVTDMRIQLLVDGVWVGEDNYPVQTFVPSGFCWLAGDSNFNFPFLGVYHFFRYKKDAVSDVFLLDDNAVTLANSGNGTATGAVVGNTNSAWEPTAGVLP